jgi:hypothetical protein
LSIAGSVLYSFAEKLTVWPLRIAVAFKDSPSVSPVDESVEDVDAGKILGVYTYGELLGSWENTTEVMTAMARNTAAAAFIEAMQRTNQASP